MRGFLKYDNKRGDPYRCVHCFQDFYSLSPILINENVFCCHGCKTVFQFLSKNHLMDYYRYQQPAPAVDEYSLFDSNENRSIYSFLDDPHFRQEKLQNPILDFYLENAHCASCVWLMDQLPFVLQEDVARAQLNIGTKVARIELKEEGSFQKVIQFLKNSGYKAQPLLEEGAQLKLKKRENQKLLFQTGIAAACAGNIMILTTALYSGADQAFIPVFEWLTFLLSLPVFIYSAQSFYSGAWRSLKSFQISIDVPVVLALLGGGTVSVYHLMIGSSHQYFDSLVIFTFLLLLGRLFQKRVEENIYSRISFEKLGQPKKARIALSPIPPYQWRETFSEKIKPGDLLKVEAGEVVPVDGEILEGRSLLQLSFLTGESEPIPVQPKMNVFAGSVNLMDTLIVQTKSIGSGTRLGKILSEIQRQVFLSTHYLKWVDSIARYFLWGVLLLSFFVLVSSYFIPFENPLYRVLALLIVACPCALAIATPLTYALMMSVGVKEGIFILNSEILEKLKNIKNIFFDKTGTLTSGEFCVESVRYLDSSFSKEKIIQSVVSLESQSVHPIAKTLVKYFQGDQWISLERVEQFQYIPLRGIQGILNGKQWSIFRRGEHESIPSSGPQFVFEVFCEKEKLSEIYLKDSVKNEAQGVLEKLKQRGYDLFLLSGDKKENCEYVATQVGVDLKNVFYSKTPEEKNAMIQKWPDTLMCGDGVNDAFALSSAHVGVALHGGIESCVESSDVYIQNKDLKKIITLFEISRGIKNTLKRNLFLSLFFNFIGVFGAVGGYVTPLFAAFFMPLSSITVVLSSLFGAWLLQKNIQERS